MILERRRDVNISLIISSVPVNTSLLSPPADCAPQKLTFGEKRMFGSVLFSRESGPGGTRLGLVACLVVSAGRERRRWCEWRPEVLLSILQVTGTAPTKGDQSLKVEKPWFWSGQ